MFFKRRGLNPERAHLAQPNHSKFHAGLQLLCGNGHAVRRQILPQLRRVSKVNRAHPQLLRAFQIQFPVVNEQTFFRPALRHFERQTVDSFIGFPNAKIAGAEKSLKFPP